MNGEDYLGLRCGDPLRCRSESGQWKDKRPWWDLCMLTKKQVLVQTSRGP